MSKVTLHGEELGLGVVLSIVQFDSSLLYVSQLILVCPIPVHISDNPWILKIDKSIVNVKMASGRRVENIEVCVFDPSAIEVRGGEGPSVKRGGILAIPFTSYPYKMSIFPNASVGNVLSHFCLSFLIEEDDGIEVRLSAVVPYPPFTRVVGILEVTSKGGGQDEWILRGMWTW